MYWISSLPGAFDQAVIDGLQYGKVDQLARIHEGVKRALQEIAFSKDDTRRGAAVGINLDMVCRCGTRVEVRRLSINHYFEILLQDASAPSGVGSGIEIGISLHRRQ
jgi:hypothetical protein